MVSLSFPSYSYRSELEKRFGQIVQSQLGLKGLHEIITMFVAKLKYKHDFTCLPQANKKKSFKRDQMKFFTMKLRKN